MDLKAALAALILMDETFRPSAHTAITDAVVAKRFGMSAKALRAGIGRLAKREAWGICAPLLEHETVWSWAFRCAHTLQTIEIQKHEEEVRRGMATPGERRPAEASLVYFLRSRYDGIIKIGIAKDPDQRLQELRKTALVEVDLLGTCPGGRPLELQLHEQFAADRVQGEWFLPSPDLLQTIQALTRAAGGDQREALAG